MRRVVRGCRGGAYLLEMGVVGGAYIVETAMTGWCLAMLILQRWWLPYRNCRSCQRWWSVEVFNGGYTAKAAVVDGAYIAEAPVTLQERAVVYSRDSWQR